MTTTLEKMATAMRGADRIDPVHEDYYIALARAALMAIREPSEGMKSAACMVGPDTAAGGFDWSDAETVFTAMIDHILSEGA